MTEDPIDDLNAQEDEELTYDEAHRQLQEVITRIGKQSLDLAVVQLGQLYRRKVWLTLQYDTWQAMCEARLRRAFRPYRDDYNARDRMAGKMYTIGGFTTYRSIADAIGIAPGTVRRAVEKTVITSDGKVINTASMKRRVDLVKSTRTCIDMTRRRAEALDRYMTDNRWPSKRKAIAKTSLSDLERIKATIDRVVKDLKNSLEGQ